MDIYENTLICNDCDKKTSKTSVNKNGFEIRAWKCKNCNKQWLHPGDKQTYDEFVKLKNKDFHVKLRMVGNSYAISIPKEIIDFIEMKDSELVRLSVQEPEKIMLFFSKITRRLY